MTSIPILYNNKEDCCGCQACANICPKKAITFTDDEYGFSYPYIDSDKCIGCYHCVKTCDFQNPTGVKSNYPLKSYAATIKNNDILKQSSSGGVFSALAIATLENKGVVFGCILDDNSNPVHICVDNNDDLESMRGSKYVQSDVGYSYQEVKRRLQSGQKVLFSGTPCQVAALRSFLGDSVYDNLLTVDLICHGVPSALMFRQYIAYLENKYNGKIVKYRFRSKARGWGNFVQEVDVVIGNTVKKKYIGSNSEFFMPNYRAGNLNRPSCYCCKYARPERVADFTMGDFWGYRKAKNLKLNPSKGLSVCLVNNEKAAGSFSEIIRYLNIEPVVTEIIIQGNGQLRMPIKQSHDWNYYMNALREGQINRVADNYVEQNKRAILKQKVVDSLPSSFITVLRSIKRFSKGLRK